MKAVEGSIGFGNWKGNAHGFSKKWARPAGIVGKNQHRHAVAGWSQRRSISPLSPFSRGIKWMAGIFSGEGAIRASYGERRLVELQFSAAAAEGKKKAQATIGIQGRPTTLDVVDFSQRFQKQTGNWTSIKRKTTEKSFPPIRFLTRDTTKRREGNREAGRVEIIPSLRLHREARVEALSADTLGNRWLDFDRASGWWERRVQVAMDCKTALCCYHREEKEGNNGRAAEQEQTR